jgi:hypothetical protein
MELAGTDSSWSLGVITEVFEQVQHKYLSGLL